MQREEAIAIQMMNHNACVNNNYSFALLLHDVTNAFYCPLDSALYEWWDQTEPEYAKDLYNQIFDCSMTVLQSAEGPVVVRQQRGVPPGLSPSTDTFTQSYTI